MIAESEQVHGIGKLIC